MITDFQQGATVIQWGKDNLFKKQYWENWISSRKKMNLDSYLHHTQKRTPNGSDLTVRAETITLLEENIRENLCDLWLGKKSS